MVLAHLARMVALILLILVCLFRPFLPGRYDALAVTLSFMAQLVGLAGLLLVPIGALWLVAEIRRRVARDRQPSTQGGGYYFALVAIVAASLVALVVSLPAFGNSRLSFGIVFVALWAACVVKWVRGLKRLKRGENLGFNPAPLYLVIVPLVVLTARLALIVPATEFSRSTAMRNSAELIDDLEGYYRANGHYPVSLASLWKDYSPAVVGIEQYHYEPNGDAYNIFFEQFTHDLAAREIVVYNKLDEQEFTSHDSWILVLSPAELENARGYFAVHDATAPDWKYFWFD